MSDHHHHAHGESCDCGHDHGHHHAHGESCDCGHDHGHHHDHGHEHNHAAHGGCSGCASAQSEAGVIRVEHRMHDEAVVVSGGLTVVAEYAVVRFILEKQLERIAREVTARGGIVGHIKASAACTETEMFSVTDTDVSVKKSPEQEIKLNVASIVFAVPPEEVEALVHSALEAVLEDC